MFSIIRPLILSQRRVERWLIEGATLTITSLSCHKNHVTLTSWDRETDLSQLRFKRGRSTKCHLFLREEGRLSQGECTGKFLLLLIKIRWSNSQMLIRTTLWCLVSVTSLGSELITLGTSKTSLRLLKSRWLPGISTLQLSLNGQRSVRFVRWF